MAAHRHFWEEVYARFDPERPARDPSWRAERPYSPRERILAALRRPFSEHKRYLVLGTVGTGKTTELYAIADAEQRERLVVMLDVWQHFEERVGDPAALDHIQPWELMTLVGLAVYAAAKDQFGHDWSRDNLDLFQHAITAIAGDSDGDGKGDGATVDVARLAGSMAVLAGGAIAGGTGAGLAVVGAVAGAAKWTLRLGRRDDKVSDQDPRVKALAGAVNALIGTVQQRYQRLTIVIDGLDRVRDTDTTRALFVDSGLLGNLPCAVIASGPLVLRHRRLGAQIRHFEPVVLANVPVLHHDAPADPARLGPGVDFFRDLYRRRVRDLVGTANADDDRAAPDADADDDSADATPLGVPPHLLDQLAYYSGGRARDFVRLVRMVAERAWDADVAAATDAMAEACIDERRRVIEMGINRADIEQLTAVAADPQRLLPDGDNVTDLLDQLYLLPYPNESEWYYPHPLLMRHRIRTAG